MCELGNEADWWSFVMVLFKCGIVKYVYRVDIIIIHECVFLMSVCVPSFSNFVILFFYIMTH